ncbi:hypothetical protein GQ54DRAFT_141575 [Martensiomyces pterosporus]|nr:hypothetical protein GQ54DRAFT_141575 [Martensiomyces pterosporus]
MTGLKSARAPASCLIGSCLLLPVQQRSVGNMAHSGHLHLSSTCYLAQRLISTLVDTCDGHSWSMIVTLQCPCCPVSSTEKALQSDTSALLY